MINISVPANVITFMRKSISVAKLDLFREWWTESGSFNKGKWTIKNDENEIIPDQIRELGYESFNTILNLTSLVDFLSMWVAAVVTFYIIKCFHRVLLDKTAFDISRNWWMTKIRLYVEDMLFYRLLLGIFLFGYMEFVIAGHYGASANSMNGFFVNMYTFISFSASLVLLPLLYYWIREKADHSFINRFSVL